MFFFSPSAHATAHCSDLHLKYAKFSPPPLLRLSSDWLPLRSRRCEKQQPGAVGSLYAHSYYKIRNCFSWGVIFNCFKPLMLLIHFYTNIELTHAFLLFSFTAFTLISSRNWSNWFKLPYHRIWFYPVSIPAPFLLLMALFCAGKGLFYGLVTGQDHLPWFVVQQRRNIRTEKKTKDHKNSVLITNISSQEQWPRTEPQTDKLKMFSLNRMCPVNKGDDAVSLFGGLSLNFLMKWNFELN